jgi:hypothetical protein
MVESVVPRARGSLAARALLLLAALVGGCGPEGEGSVAAAPKGGGEIAASKKGASPRVPRGPEAAKVLQESAPKK